MADIDIKCPKCEHIVTVSEFADPQSIACRKCGEKLGMPEGGVQKARPTVKVTKKEDAEPLLEEPPKEWRFHKTMVKDDSPGKSTILTPHHVISWAIFLVLGGIVGWLRYGGQLQPSNLVTMKQFAPYVLLALHIGVLVVAFRDSVFQGILGLMIPPYLYYFLFAVSDQFYLRAIVAGTMVGFGQDAFIFVGKYSGVIYTTITDWIAKGG